jgi:proteasome lid subunit RPN8/RPN11
LLKIAPTVIADMLAHAREEAPRECCGLLVGTGDEISRGVRARNLESAATRYLVDPQDHFRAIRLARSEGKDVVGAYHSHPAGAPAPSETDLAQAAGGSDFLYVIVSLVAGEVRAYRCEDGAFVHLPFSVTPSRPSAV